MPTHRATGGVRMSAFDGTGARRLTARDCFNSLYQMWAVDLAPRTSRRYRHELNRWEALTDNPPLADVTTAVYQQFRAASSQAGHAAGTTESTLRFIRQLMRCAMAHGAVTVMPDRGRPRRIEAPQPHPPSVEELDKLFRACGVARWPRLHVPSKLFWRSWMAVALWTALRREDIFWRLQLQHINFSENVILFRSGKVKAPHPFPLCPVIVRHIRAMIPAFPVPQTRVLFGPSRSPHLIQRELDRIADAAEVRRVTPQSFRQAGINAWTLSDPRAGEIIHGCGIPRVLSHYLDRLQILRHAAENVVVPTAMCEFGDSKRQGILFV